MNTKISHTIQFNIIVKMLFIIISLLKMGGFIYVGPRPKFGFKWAGPARSSIFIVLLLHSAPSSLLPFRYRCSSCLRQEFFSAATFSAVSTSFTSVSSRCFFFFFSLLATRDLFSYSGSFCLLTGVSSFLLL